jgi:hypothetical protein
MMLYRYVQPDSSLQPVSSQQGDSVLSDQAPIPYEPYCTEHNSSPSQYARLHLPNQVKYTNKIKNSSVMFSSQNNNRYQQDYKKFCNNSLHNNFSFFISGDLSHSDWCSSITSPCSLKICYKNREHTSLTCVMPSLQYTYCIKWNISITFAPKETQNLNTDPSSQLISFMCIQVQC